METPARQQLVENLDELIKHRLATIHCLESLADDIDDVNSQTRRALISGHTVAIAGAVVGVPVGIAALVVSGGTAAVPLIITAGVFSGVGGAGSLGSLIARFRGNRLVNSKYEEALKALEVDTEIGEKFLSCWDGGPDGEATSDEEQTDEQVDEQCPDRKEIVEKTATRILSGSKILAKAGSKIAKLRSVFKSGESAIDAAGAAARASRVALGIGVAVGIILLPLDVYNLVRTTRDIRSGARHEKAEEIRQMAAKLLDELQSLIELKHRLTEQDRDNDK